ncbi:hypothetical protein ACT453_11875 [Bacillus sp. D-CC]
MAINIHKESALKSTS